MDTNEITTALRDANKGVNALLGKIRERFDDDFVSDRSAVADVLIEEGFVGRFCLNSLAPSGETYRKGDLDVALTVTNRLYRANGVTRDFVELHVRGDGYIAHLPLDNMSRYFEKKDAA